MDINNVAKEIREKGLKAFPGIYSKKQCEEFKTKANAIVESLIAKKSHLVHQDCQYIFNPFRHDPELMQVVTNEVADQVLSKLIDPDYVLINSTILNRKHRDDIQTGYQKSLGDDWHTDSRYIYGERLDQGFGYIVCMMLDDFTTGNAGTNYIPGSHKWRTIPERQGNYEYETLVGEAGTMVIFDSGLWHRAGKTTQNDRWSAFNLYGPWFMKPYFNFPEMMGPEYGKKASVTIQRLLHYNSIPPLNEDERVSTLQKLY